jgi:ABC-type transport system substrate-binding protein
MKHNKFMLVFAFVLIASLVLSACQPQTIIQTVEVEREVERVVRETEVVEVEVEVERTQVVEVERAAFTEPHPILGDVRVRQAMAYCTNKVDLARAGYPLLDVETAETLVMNTQIPSSHWAYAGDENVTLYPFDVESGQALLDEAGWVDAGSGVRQKDGMPLALKFYTTNAAFRMAWAAVWERQMADCGIQILRSHVPASWWFGDNTGLAVRDFEIGAFAWVGQADPGGVTLYSCDQIPLPSNNWEGQNYMGWCNPQADAGVKNANNTLLREERIQWYTQLQQAYAEDVPAIPLFNRTETFATRANMTGFAPVTGEEYYTYNVHEWAIPGEDTIVIGWSQEPTSLYTIAVDHYNATLAVSLMGFPRGYTTLNYDFQPLYQTELATLESGLAQNNDVEVSAGTMVVNAAGDVEELANGVVVKDAQGNEVEFTGSAVTMKQLVVEYPFRDDMVWQDGTPVTSDDWELAYELSCSRESGATSFFTCDRTEDIVFDGSTITLTYVAGYQSPLYFTYPFSAPIAGHQPIETAGAYQGQTLRDVPFSEWSSLPEAAETPYSFGPYQIVSWTKGESMVFEPNPNWYGGAPATPNIVISFVTPENAEPQLLGGQVDILASETLAGLSEQLVAAEEAGQIVTYVEPGATWEHIDFNLFVR